MDYSSAEESDISDTEIIEYKEKPYAQLRNGKYKVKGPNGSLRCSFCTGKKKQNFKYKDLLQHASGVGKGSSNRTAKQKANHLALAQYLEIDLANETEQPQRVATPAPAAQHSEQSDLYCWPWTGIIVNIVKEPNNGRAANSKEYLMEKYYRYNSSEVVIFWDGQEQTGQAILKFDNDWTGLKNAMDFEKFFEADHHIKKELGFSKTSWVKHVWLVCSC